MDLVLCFLVKVKVLVTHLCPALCNHVDCSPGGGADREACHAAVHELQSQTRLSD